MADPFTTLQQIFRNHHWILTGDTNLAGDSGLINKILVADLLAWRQTPLVTREQIVAIFDEHRHGLRDNVIDALLALLSGQSLCPTCHQEIRP